MISSTPSESSFLFRNSTHSIRRCGFLLVISVILLSATSCKNSNKMTASQNSNGENNLSGNVLKMQRYSIFDSQMGIPAFSVLAPSGYKMQGGITWNSNLANLVTADVAITSPDNSVGFYVHPAPMYISGSIENQWQRGQLYLGMMVMPIPNSPTEYIRQYLLPQRRPGARNVQLVDETDLSDWARSVAAINDPYGTEITGYGVRARFAYSENGADWEEDFYCVVVVARPQMGVQNVRWLADRNLSVRAHKGELESLGAVVRTFVQSFKVEKSWYARFSKAQSQWIAMQQQGIHNAGVLSNIISSTNDYFDQTMSQSWQAKQQAEERAAREFTEYIRDTENYSDPLNERNVELPGGYEKAWGNVNGEYILSNDAGFDPNRDSNVEWREIRKLR